MSRSPLLLALAVFALCGPARSAGLAVGLPRQQAPLAPTTMVLSAGPALALPFPSMTAAPALLSAAPAPAPAAASESPKPVEPAVDTVLSNLSDGIAAGKNGPAADGGTAAISRTFDNADAKKSARGIPLDWVDAMIAKKGSTDAQSRRLQDIVQSQGFLKAAMNRDILQNHTDKYTVEIPMGAITNQQQSGRCWLFAGLNMLRSMMVADKQVPAEFEFSQNYLHFFNMLEKANRQLEDVSRKVYRRSSPKDFSSAQRRAAVIPDMGDGGYFEWFAFLVSKYGLAPKSAMGETISSEATAVLLNELDDSLAATSAEMLANAKRYKAGREPNRAQEIADRGRTRVWKILVTHLGTPPARFDYRQNGKPTIEGRVSTTPTTVKTYTPREFARDFVKFDPRDYVSVTSYPGKKENVVYEVKDSAIGRPAPGEPSYDRRGLNVGEDRIEALAAEAIRGGQPVLFSSGVNSRKDIDSETGIMHPRLFDRDPIYGFTDDESAPILTRKQASYFARIGPNHAMVLTGYDQPDASQPIVKFKVENSWGKERGTKGVFHAYREWFRQNVFRIVVHKRFLSEKETVLWNGKASELGEQY